MSLIKIAALDAVKVRNLGTTDRAGRWYPRDEIASYFSSIRTPSRAWPFSYWTAARTQKFARWVMANHPELL